MTESLTHYINFIKFNGSDFSHNLLESDSDLQAPIMQDGSYNEDLPALKTLPRAEKLNKSGQYAYIQIKAPKSKLEPHEYTSFQYQQLIMDTRELKGMSQQQALDYVESLFKEATPSSTQQGQHLPNTWGKDAQGDDCYYGADGRPVEGLQTIGGVDYYFANHKDVKNSWQKIDQTYYYFDNYGHAVNGWQSIGSSWYYFKNNRLTVNQVLTVPTTGEHNGGTYRFDQNGHFLTNVWGKDAQGDDCYFGVDGRAVEGLQRIGGVLYGFVNHKNIKNRWQKIDQTYYYFDNYGHAVNGWQLIGTSWYYFKNNQLITNQVLTVPTTTEYNGGTYYFDQNGHYLTNAWIKDTNGNSHYLGADGRAVTGLVQINNITYQFNDYQLTDIQKTIIPMVDGIKWYPKQGAVKSYTNEQAGEPTISDGITVYKEHEKVKLFMDE